MIITGQNQLFFASHKNFFRTFTNFIGVHRPWRPAGENAGESLCHSLLSNLGQYSGSNIIQGVGETVSPVPTEDSSPLEDSTDYFLCADTDNYHCTLR